VLANTHGRQVGIAKMYKRLLGLGLVCLFTSAAAPAGARTNKEILAEFHRAVREAKSQKAIEGAILWCIDGLVAPVLLENVELKKQALSALKEGDNAKAAQLLERAEEGNRAGRILAKSLCRPD
jgi:hypothetical protein